MYQDMYSLHGKVMKAISGLRSMEDQGALYARGRTSPGSIVTRSRPGDSLHNFGCALDSCFAGADPFLDKLDEAEFTYYWGEFGRFSEAQGLSWGGRWDKITDRPHVQITYGLRLMEIQELYKKGGLKEVWSELDKRRGIPVGSEWIL